MPMRVFSSMTQEKLVVPRFSFSRVGKPSSRVSTRLSPMTMPDMVVPAMQATARATMVFLVAKDRAMARTAVMMEMMPMLVNSSM